MNQKKIVIFNSFVFWTLIVLAVSVLAGSSSFIFLKTLEFSMTSFQNNHHLIWGLPFITLLTRFVYKNYGIGANQGSNLPYLALQKKNFKIPFRTLPFIFIFSNLSHLFGASVGREGVAIQMSSSLADSLTQKFSLNNKRKKIIIRMAMAGGFSSIFGTPLAGFIFSLESPRESENLWSSITPCFVTAYLANWLAVNLGATHTIMSANFNLPNMDVSLIAKLAIFGFCCGLISKIYTKFSKNIKCWIDGEHTYLKTITVSILLSILLFKTHFYYSGLGLNIINDSLTSAQHWYTALSKFLFTSVSTSIGLKGGEVTPLFSIGSSFGSFFSSQLNLNTSSMAQLGFAAVFAGCAHVPWTCAILTSEIFGPTTLPYAIFICLIANKFSGLEGIYSAQHISYKGWLR